jgi:molybdopterin converting factor subunit 1
MKVHVLLFAGLREKAGKSETWLELPEFLPVKDLREPLGFTEREWSPLAFAVNLTYVPPLTQLQDGDEVALIPPVAGG